MRYTTPDDSCRTDPSIRFRDAGPLVRAIAVRE
jgi:hypothetical protein